LLPVVQYGCSKLANVDLIGIPIIRMNNLQVNGWNFSDLKWVELSESEINTYLLKPNDLIFNRTNSKELVGKCEVFRELGEWVFASYLIRVQTNEDQINPQFAADFLNAPTGRLQIDQLSRQIIGMTNMNAEEIKSIRIPLPSLEQQANFVAVVDAARSERRAKLAEADALLAGLDDYLLATLGLIPLPKDERKVFAIRRSTIVSEGRHDPRFHHPCHTVLLRAFAACPFEKRNLGMISREIVGGATPTKGSAECYAADGIKFFRILNIKANEFELSDLNYIKCDVHQGDLSRSQLAENDVLMTITGRVGNAAVVTAELLPANINQHIVRLRITSDDIRPHYLALYLNCSIGLALSNRWVTGGTRIALDYGAIRALQIPVPPLHLQDLIIAESRRRCEEARRLCTEAETGWQTAKRWFEEQLLGPAQP